MKWSDGTTTTELKFQDSEDRAYVRRSSSDEDAVAEAAKQVRSHGGTKSMAWGRGVASIPAFEFYQMDRGHIYDGRYKGISSADKETRNKLLAKYLANEGARFKLNDTARGRF